MKAQQTQDAALRQEAMTALSTAIEASPDKGEYLTELGIAYYEGGDLENAHQTLQKAVSKADVNALGWAYYGVTLKDKQQFPEAAEYFKKAVEAYPNYGLAHWGLAWSSFGQITAGCPCTPEDEALVQVIVEHAKQAVQYGVNDPALQERADILARGEKVK